MDFPALSRLAEEIGSWTPPKDCHLRNYDPAFIDPALSEKAETLFRLLVPLADRTVRERGRAVVSLFGGSGTGKSGSAALLEAWFRAAGVACLVVNGDNYPHRIPVCNDAERLRRFRSGGRKTLRAAGLFDADTAFALNRLLLSGRDADPQEAARLPWLRVYQSGGKTALEAYLGTPLEQDFDALNALLDDFHAGKETLRLKKLGRAEDERGYETADGQNLPLLILEWTHGGSERLRGVDIPVLLLGSTEETMPYRRARNRDADTDAPFTTTVLNIEQAKLLARADSAAIILSRDGKPVTANESGG